MIAVSPGSSRLAMPASIPEVPVADNGNTRPSEAR